MPPRRASHRPPQVPELEFVTNSTDRGPKKFALQAIPASDNGPNGDFDTVATRNIEDTFIIAKSIESLSEHTAVTENAMIGFVAVDIRKCVYFM